MRLLFGVVALVGFLPGCLKSTAARLPPDEASARALSATGPNVGQLAPEIGGGDLDGVPMRLSDYRGKVVLLDFWGHW